MQPPFILHALTLETTNSELLKKFGQYASLLSVAVINTMTQRNLWGRKHLFGLYFCHGPH